MYQTKFYCFQEVGMKSIREEIWSLPDMVWFSFVDKTIDYTNIPCDGLSFPNTDVRLAILNVLTINRLNMGHYTVCYSANLQHALRRSLATPMVEVNYKLVMFRHIQKVLLPSIFNKRSLV